MKPCSLNAAGNSSLSLQGGNACLDTFFFASPPGRRALVNRTIGSLLSIWWETLVFQDSFPLPVAASPLCSHSDALMSTGDNRIICCSQAGPSVGEHTPFRGLGCAERGSDSSVLNCASGVDHLKCRVQFLLLVHTTFTHGTLRMLMVQEIAERVWRRSVSRTYPGLGGCLRKTPLPCCSPALFLSYNPLPAIRAPLLNGKCARSVFQCSEEG